MKKLFFIFFIPSLLLYYSGLAQEKTFEEHFSKKINARNLAFFGIYNLNGSVYVEGYDGNEIIIEIDKKIKAKSGKELDNAKNEFKLNFDERGKNLYVYIEKPWNTAPKAIRGETTVQQKKGEQQYSVKLEFKVKVPRNLALEVSGVNAGVIEIKDFTGQIKASNVNGKISMQNVTEVAKVKSVNGSIDISFVKSPDSPSEIKTVNGKITLSYPSDLEGEFSLKATNGDYYTNFDYSNPASNITTDASQSGTLKKYKIGKDARIKIGGAGQKHQAETVNGSIYIKKNS
jgi:hypothetical protein